MTTVTDNFNRANEATGLLSPWISNFTGNNNINLTSNAAVPTFGSDCVAVMSGTFGNDQSVSGNVSGQLTGIGGGSGIGFVLRHATATGTDTGYRLAIAGGGAGNNIEMARFVGGAYTSLQFFAIGTWANGDLFQWTAIGAPPAVVLTLYRNGTQIATTTDVSGSGIASGNPGIGNSSVAGSDALIDNWVGTDVFGVPMEHDVPITAGSGVGVDTQEVTKALFGTVSKAATTTVTGSGSAFLSELRAGDVIRIPGGTSTETRIVSAVASDTSLTVTVAFTTTASAQTGLRVSQRQVMQWGPASLSTPTTVTAAAADTTLVALNRRRIGLSVYNDSTSTLYLKYGTGASSSSYTVRISGGGYWQMPVPIYTGAVNGNWVSATGSAYVTELTI